MLIMIKSCVLASLVAIMCVFIGCSGDKQAAAENKDDGKTHIEFWHYFSQHQAKPLEELVKKFEEANPTISVRPVFQGNPSQLKQKLDGSFASGTNNNPTVSMVYESWVDDFHARKYISPVHTYFDGADGMSADDQKDFVKAFIEGNSWDGKLVTLPFNKSIYLLYVNMDKLKQAGYTTAPATLAQLEDAARKLTVKQGSRTAVYGWGMMPKVESLTTLLLASGGEFMGADGKPALNSPVALEVAQTLKNLQYPDKNLYIAMDYMSVPFANQMIGMYIYSSASLPYNQTGAKGKFNYQAAPIPGKDGTAPGYLMQGTNIAIYANKTDAERNAAWKLVKYLTSPGNGAYFVTRSGYMPYRYSMLNEPEFKTYMEQNPDYAMAAQLVLTDKGIQEPKVKAWEGIRTEIDKAVDQLLSRPDSNPKALLDALQSKAEEKL